MVGLDPTAEKARLTTWLVGQRTLGVATPRITEAIVRFAKNARDPLAAERAMSLLHGMATSAESIAGWMELNRELAMASQQEWTAMAWSGSASLDELTYLLGYLQSVGWVTKSQGQYFYQVTVDGHRALASKAAERDTAKVFIAMWFDGSMDDVFPDAIQPAVQDAGFSPVIIREKDHVNKIEDEVIAEIQRARFVVADFSHGKDGARGSVYYEAGFAQGLGLPVIYTCRREDMKDLHFDTSHYNHIDWESKDDLRSRLEKRIVAVVGQGPEIYPAQ